MLLQSLLRASLDGTVVVLLAWTMTRLLPRLSPAARAVIWWCAAAKFIVSLVWIAPVPVPILPAATIGGSPVAVSPVSVDPSPPIAAATEPGTASSHARFADRVDWTTALLAAWGIGVAVVTGIGVKRASRMHRVASQAVTSSNEVRAIAVGLAARIGVERVPEVRLSAEIDTPLAWGLSRPVILLPRDAVSTWSDTELRMAICHELAHVLRKDLWLGCLPAFAERLFFFHPFVHAAAREYALWREAACDAVVLTTLDVAPRDYGRMLIDLGVMRRRSGLAAAVASSSFRNLKRRIAMLGASSMRPLQSRVLAAAAVGFSAVALIPLQLAARTSGAAPTIARPDVPLPAEASQKDEPSIHFVLFVSDDRTMMSGSTEDVERARRFRRPGEQILWFRDGGREYVIRDPDVLRHVVAIWQPVNDIGDEQGRVGTEQGLLGTRQGELGAQQGQLGARQGELGTRQGVLGTRQAVLANDESYGRTAAGREVREKERRQIELEMKQLDLQMRALDAQMRQLDAPMRDLGKQMDVLARQLDALTAKMKDAVATAEREMRSLVTRAIASGVAEQR